MRPRCDVANEGTSRATSRRQRVSRAAAITPPHRDDQDDDVVDGIGIGVPSVDERRAMVNRRPMSPPIHSDGETAPQAEGAPFAEILKVGLEVGIVTWLAHGGILGAGCPPVRLVTGRSFGRQVWHGAIRWDLLTGLTRDWNLALGGLLRDGHGCTSWSRRSCTPHAADGSRMRAALQAGTEPAPNRA